MRAFIIFSFFIVFSLCFDSLSELENDHDLKDPFENDPFFAG